MIKKIISVVLCLFLIGCSAKNEINLEDEIIEIPVESVVGISAEQAQNLCDDVMGESDETTGFPFSFGVSGAILVDNHQFYVVRASWLVNNSHMSYIGDFFVLADGSVIYDGVAYDGKYEIINMIWSNE